MSAVRICLRCQTADRYKSGHCKQCLADAKIAKRAQGRLPIAEISRRAVLAAMPGTYKTAMEESGLGASAVQKHLRRMHESGQLHIRRWVRPQGQGLPAPFYALGAGLDAPRPSRLDGKDSVLRQEVVRAKRRDVRGMVFRPAPDQMVPRALMGQRERFPLAGVWA